MSRLAHEEALLSACRAYNLDAEKVQRLVHCPRCTAEERELLDAFMAPEGSVNLAELRAKVAISKVTPELRAQLVASRRALRVASQVSTELWQQLGLSGNTRALGQFWDELEKESCE